MSKRTLPVDFDETVEAALAKVERAYAKLRVKVL